MKHNRLLTLISVLTFMTGLATAQQVSSCTGDFSNSAGVCNFYENGTDLIDMSLNTNNIITGAVGINYPDGSLSDVLNFYLNGDGNVHVTLYSDSAIPDTLLTPFIGATEDSTGFASYNVGNVYNVYSDTSVPEPGSLSLLALGLIGAGLKWRVRRG